MFHTPIAGGADAAHPARTSTIAINDPPSIFLISKLPSSLHKQCVENYLIGSVAVIAADFFENEIPSALLPCKPAQFADEAHHLAIMRATCTALSLYLPDSQPLAVEKAGYFVFQAVSHDWETRENPNWSRPRSMPGIWAAP